MRLIFGLILGVALAAGVAFLHDGSVPRDPQHQIVNWSVLGGVVDDATAIIRRQWDHWTGRARG